MPRLPRLALARPAFGSEPAFASLALLAGLTAAGWRVQHFRSRARPFGTTTVSQISGLPERHLDAWLMPPEVCREVFARGALRADLAVVEGTLDPPDRQPDRFPFDRPGRLAPLIEALELPTLALVSCPSLREIHLPRLPVGTQAILIDGFERAEDFAGIKRVVELVLRRPVVGGVEALPEARAAIAGLAFDEAPCEPLIACLAASFLRFADLNALRALAESKPFPPFEPFEQRRTGRRFQVAYAQDEAFGGYYPDTLEMLEALGAELVEFSPLRSEALPDGIDLVILGCGFPDRFGDELAANVSLMSSLRGYVCRGQRIYAEGGGTIYLGRSFQVDGRCYPGVGILPFDAVLRDQPRGPTPVSRVLLRESWLGPAGTAVRGYRCSRWCLRPAPEPEDGPARSSGALTAQRDMFFRHHAIGSLIHLHLAALPEVVQSFAGPHQPSLWLPSRARN